MSRPSPEVLTEIFDQKTKKTSKVLKSDGIWTVYYDNVPINFKSESIEAFVSPRYKPVSFSNSGHAINLAKKLNKQFSTNKFTVVLLTYAETIYSE